MPAFGESCLVLLIVAAVLIDVAVNAAQSKKSHHAKSKHGIVKPATSGTSRQLIPGPGMAMSTSCITGRTGTPGIKVTAKPCTQDGAAQPPPSSSDNAMSTGCTAMMYEFIVSTCTSSLPVFPGIPSLPTIG